jgi:phosphatidyl-myo-inositol dimannoside synthase
VRTESRWPVFAAISTDATGGGIGVASQLMWTVVRERWGDVPRLVVLRQGDSGTASTRSGLVSRLRFGARLAGAQVRGECSWLFFTHLSLSRVQRFVLPAWRRPYAIYLHGIEAWRPLPEVDLHLLRAASLLVANSSHTARRVAEAHAGLGRIDVCPLALGDGTAPAPGDRVATWRRLVGAHGVVTVGRMVAAERYKGHDQLLEAWGDVRQRVPDARLVFAGAGDDVARLQAKAGDLGLAGSVTFTGFLDAEDLQALYSAASVFAMPSRDEGFGLVYLEAMSHGLPCIGSIHDAAGEVIEDGVTGFLVDQSDRASLSARLTGLLGDDDQRTAMGTRARDRVRERFRYEIFRNQFVALLSDAFDGAPSAEAGSRRVALRP